MKIFGAETPQGVKSGTKISVHGRTFIVYPFIPRDKVAGYDVQENGSLFLHINWAPLGVYQIQELISSKIQNKPSQLVKKEFLLRRIWASLMNPSHCRRCRSELDRGHICMHCFAGEWPPLDQQGLIAEVEKYRRQSRDRWWEYRSLIEVLREALQSADASELEWFNRKYPERKAKEEPKAPSYLDKDPGPDPTMPPTGTESPQPNIPGLGLSDRLPRRR